MSKETQAELNIGVIGHVDHGKTSLTSKLTGRWTDRHSEEIKQGISIKLGYADASFYIDESLSGVQAYCTSKTHPLTGNKAKLVKKVSFVDNPGHETLMAVMLSSATLLNGALLVVAANEPCPQPRTVEHVIALKMHGIKHLVVAQNKIDLVTKEEAKKNYESLRKFLDDEGYNDSPIIPTSAHFDANIDALIYALVNYIPTPKFNEKEALKMQVVRSFDVNKPGTEIKDLKGGIIGGAILKGSLNVGQAVWLYPGIDNNPVEFKIKSLNSGSYSLKTAHPGGLIAIGTDFDPLLCNSDKMVGQVVCVDESKPLLTNTLSFNYNKIDRLLKDDKTSIRINDKLVLIIGSTAYLALVKKIKNNNIDVILNKPAVFYQNDRIAVSRNIKSRWRLSGYGEIK